MEVRVGQLGKIIRGDELGHYVKVVREPSRTDGLLILTSADADMTEGHDCWVENTDALRRFFDKAHWVVDWHTQPPRDTTTKE